jgi:hypothetical protein
MLLEFDRALYLHCYHISSSFGDSTVHSSSLSWRRRPPRLIYPPLLHPMSFVLYSAVWKSIAIIGEEDTSYTGNITTIKLDGITYLLLTSNHTPNKLLIYHWPPKLTSMRHYPTFESFVPWALIPVRQLMTFAYSPQPVDCP